MADGKFGPKTEKAVKAMQACFDSGDKEKAKKLAEILYASSELVAGVDVEDPVGFVNLITELF